MYQLRHDCTTRGDFETTITTNFINYGSTAVVNGNHNPHKFNSATLETGSYDPSNPRTFCSDNDTDYILSSYQTGQDKKFATPLSITLSFSKTLSFNGLKLYCGNIMTSFGVAAFKNNILIYNLDLMADAENYFIDYTFKEVNKIVFTINSLDVACRFFRLYGINLGKVRVFGESDLMNLKMERNLSISTREAPFSVLEFELKENTDYLFQENQPISVLSDNWSVYDFYVSESDGTRVKCLSALSTMNQKINGRIYENPTTVAQVMFDIFYSVHNKNYSIDKELSSKKVSGYIPNCTLREALIYITMAIGAVIDDKNGSAWITTLEENETTTFTSKNLISKEEKTEKRIESVVLVHHNYSKSQDTIELYNWYIAQSETRTINFSQPIHSLVAYRVSTDGETKALLTSKQFQFVEVGSNFCTVRNVNVADKIIIEGKKYIDNKEELIKTNADVPADTDYTMVTIENATLLSTNPLLELNRFHNHYAKNKLITCQVLSDDVAIGSKVDVLGYKGNVLKVTTNFNGITEIEVR